MIVPFETRAYRSTILSSSSRLIAKYFQDNCKNTEGPRIGRKYVPIFFRTIWICPIWGPTVSMCWINLSKWLLKNVLYLFNLWPNFTRITNCTQFLKSDFIGSTKSHHLCCDIMKKVYLLIICLIYFSDKCSVELAKYEYKKI